MQKRRKVLKIGSQGTAYIVEEEHQPKIDSPEEKGKFISILSLSSELGFAISLPIAGGALLGTYLDGKFHTSPRITLSLIFLGVMIAATNIYLIVREADLAEKQKSRK